MGLLELADTVLVAVDVQPAFIEQASMGEEERRESAEALDRLLWLAGLATMLEIPAVVVEEGPERSGSTDPRLLERLAPETPVLAKRTFGLGGQPDAVGKISETGRRSTVLVGFETDTCVAQSAIQLGDLGHRVIVVEDAVSSTGRMEHARGLSRIRQAGIEVSDCKGVIFQWVPVVDEALAVVRAAKERFGEPPMRL